MGISGFRGERPDLALSVTPALGISLHAVYCRMELAKFRDFSAIKMDFTEMERKGYSILPANSAQYRGLSYAEPHTGCYLVCQSQ